MGMLLGYIKELYDFSQRKFILNVLLMVVLGMVEGIGVLMLIPLLSVAGIIPGIQGTSGFAFEVNQLFHNIGMTLNLPMVLVIYTFINFGQSWLQRY